MGQRWGDCQKPLRDAAAPASCKGTGCSMPMPCFPTPKGEKSNPSVTKKKQTLGHTRSLHSLKEGLSAPTPQHCSTYCRMNWMASSYFIPLSIKASATRTGALKHKNSGCHSPVTQPRG